MSVPYDVVKARVLAYQQAQIEAKKAQEHDENKWRDVLPSAPVRPALCPSYAALQAKRRGMHQAIIAAKFDKAETEQKDVKLHI